MELNKKEIFIKKIHRKKFFVSLGTGFFGLILFNSFPFKLFTTKEMKKEKQITIQINPLAVRRKNPEGKNA
jgi:hypothetical protein